MAPIDDAHTGLDLMARLGHPVILVTGSYLGALSHTLTALAALRGRGIVVTGDRRLRIGAERRDSPTRSKACVNLPGPMFRCMLCRDSREATKRNGEPLRP